MLSRIYFFVSLLLLVWIPVASGYAEENKTTRIASGVELSDSNGLINPNSPLNNKWEFTGNINDKANFNLDLKFKGFFRKNFTFFSHAADPVYLLLIKMPFSVILNSAFSFYSGISDCRPSCTSGE